MTILTPQQAITPGAAGLPWRMITPLHREFGAQSIRTQIPVLAGATPLQIANFKYGPMTIDRVIGVYLGIGGITAGTVTLQELGSNWSWTKTVAANQLNYWLNIETLQDGLDLVFTSSVAITQAMLVNISLFNVEIAPAAL